MRSTSTPPRGVKAWRPRKTREVIVIGSERMLDQADTPEFEEAPAGIENARDSNESSLEEHESAARMRMLPGRVVAAGAIVAVVGVLASVFGGGRAGETSNRGDGLVASEVPAARDREARGDFRNADKVRAGGGATTRQSRPKGGVEGQAPRSLTRDDSAATAPLTAAVSEGLGEKTAASTVAVPPVGNAPVAATPSAPVAAGDAGGAVVPATGAEVREEFGP